MASVSNVHAPLDPTVADSDLGSPGWVPRISGFRKLTGDHENPAELSKIASVHGDNKTW